MANVGDTLPHCTGTGTQENPYIYTTEEGFVEAIAVTESYIEAGEPNLNFDANNGVITRVVFRCKYIDGKGTTIRNLFTQNSNSILIYFQTTSSGYTIDVYNINFYNMCILTSDAWHLAKFISDAGSGYQGHTKFFKNCNFTGIFKGRPRGNSTCIIGGEAWNSLAFKDCTFNLNFNTTVVGNNTELVIFQGDGSYPIEMSNCTICISGKIPTEYNYAAYLCKSVVLDNCVFTNSSTNPLALGNGTPRPKLVMTVASSGSKFSTTYNYFKMYITGSNREGTVDVGNNHILVNTSRITGIQYITNGIQMQETDSTQTNYIYNAENLTNAGFLVGQVIP